MHFLRVALSRMAGLFTRKQRDEYLDSEIRLHLELLTEKYVRSGVTLGEAARMARREFGSTEPMREIYRDRRSIPFIEDLVRDIRLAARGLRKSPIFAMAAVTSLALGIGANTAIFSFVDSILLTHLPVPDSDRLVRLAVTTNGSDNVAPLSVPFVEQVTRHQHVFDGFFGQFPVLVNLESDGSAQPISGEMVTGQYFRALQLRPVIGRLMTEADVEHAKGDPVCVISYRLWQSRFGGDPKIEDRKLFLNSYPYSILGVTPASFSGSSLHGNYDIQVPVSRLTDFMPAMAIPWKSPDFSWLSALGRLRPGITIAQANAEVSGAAIELGAIPKEGNGKLYHLIDGSCGLDEMRSRLGQSVLVLMGVVSLVLLAACTNLANLLLARGSARRQEFAIRLSLGASRGRLVRQLLIEALLLAGLGGALGVTLSFWMTSTLLHFFNTEDGPGGGLQITPHPALFAFAAGLSLLTALLFGLAPAWQSTRLSLTPGLKGQEGAKPGHPKLRSLLVVLQISLSVVVLVVAGLLTKTLRSLRTIDLGFKPENVIVFRIDPSMSGYSPSTAESFYKNVLDRTQRIPQVTYTSLAVSTPLDGNRITMGIEVPGYVLRNRENPTPIFNIISPGYFATLNEQILVGRDFGNRDSSTAPRVVMVNEEFVKHYFGGRSGVGRKFRHGDSDVEIVGVVKNAHEDGLRNSSLPTVYLSWQQATSTSLTLLVRSRIDPAAMIPQVKAVVRSIDPRLSVLSARTLRAQIDGGLSNEQILSLLSTLFSVLATALAAIGLYGVVAYSMSQRTREIGVRLAIGARRSDIVNLFLRGASWVIAPGLILGLVLAVIATQGLKSLLYGVKADDAMTLGVAGAVVFTVSLAATLLPMRKASRIDPMRALRYD